MLNTKEMPSFELRRHPLADVNTAEASQRTGKPAFIQLVVNRRNWYTTVDSPSFKFSYEATNFVSENSLRVKRDI